jgi:hypothetical protein
MTHRKKFIIRLGGIGGIIPSRGLLFPFEGSVNPHENTYY